MCGIVGIGSFSGTRLVSADKDAFLNALVADSARGFDGTGVYKVNDKGKCVYSKSTGNPFDLFRTPYFVPDFWNKVTSEWTAWLVGHNRLATKGGKSSESAHPFQHGDITLVHNGTLRNAEWPELKEFTVDSEALCASIAVRGLKATLSGMDGAYAIVYYDAKNKTLNMVRNDERPLFYGYNKKSKHVAFGSEWDLIEWACNRNNISLEKYMEIPEKTLFTWELTDFEPQITKLEIKDYKKKKKETTVYSGFDESKWVFVNGVYELRAGALKSDNPLPPEGHNSVNNYPPVKMKDSFPHVMAKTLPAVVGDKKKEGSFEDDLSRPFVVVRSYDNIAIGEKITLAYEDYDNSTKTASGDFSYLVKAKSTLLFPGFRVRGRVIGQNNLDALSMADFMVGTIVNIIVYRSPGKDEPIGTVWVTNLQAEFVQKKFSENVACTPANVDLDLVNRHLKDIVSDIPGDIDDMLKDVPL